MMRGFALFFIMVCVLASGCASARMDGEPSYREAGNINFKFKAYTVNIKDPARDRRCYYRIFIDKVEAGRTSTGLESQFVTFDAKLSVNRHLLEVEKWVLDQRENRYVKLNRIDQPRPNFVYFEIPGNRIVQVTLVTDDEKGRAMFGVDLERN